LSAAALQEVFDRCGERFGDSGYIAAELPSAVGLPLRNRASANVTRVSQIFLRHALIAPQGSNSRADSV
jgi:hypothetical protein